MKKNYLIITTLLFLTGCSEVHTVEYQLRCYVDSVSNENLGKVTLISKEEAIKNNFLYDFKIYSDDFLIVNDMEKYYRKKSTNNDMTDHHFSVLINEKTNDDVTYIFNKFYTDVSFRLSDRNISYSFECESPSSN